ncbi:MAG: response regulator [Acidobacteria bacterium]|nr:response regulator [Acidobacteriota bacterium]
MRSPAGSVRAAVCALAVSIGTAAYAQHHSYQTFGFEDGLTNLAVEAVLQDRDGFLWVATQNGLFRFDGHSFTEMGKRDGMPPDSLLSLHQSADGTLWAAFQTGLWRREGGRFLKTESDLIGRMNGVQTVASDAGGRVYLATRAGLAIGEKLERQSGWRFREADLSILGADQNKRKCSSVLVTAADEVMFSCETSILKLQGDKAVQVIPGGLSRDEWWQYMLEDPAGNLWVRSKNMLKVRRAGSKTLSQVDCPRNLRSPWTPQLGLDLRGRLLVPMIEGLGILSEARWRFVTRAQGLPAISVSSVHRDREGSIWLGMLGRGLARWIGYGEWEGYTYAEGLENETVWQILPDGRGTIWVSTQDGLYRGRKTPGIDGLRFERFPGLEPVDIQALALDKDGTIWAGLGDYAIANVDPRTGTVKRYPIPEIQKLKTVTHIELSPDGRIWASSIGHPGLFVGCKSCREFKSVKVPDSGDADGLTVKVLPNGDLLYCTKGGLHWNSKGVWRKFTKADGLKDDGIWGVTPGPEGDLWITYQAALGLSRMTREGDKLKLRHWGVKDGLPSEQVYFSKFDPQGRMWVGTDRGVGVWDGKQWTHYRRGDGLVWDDLDTDAFAAEQDGTIWIGTAGGLSKFKESVELRATPWPPAVVFTSARLGSNEVDLSKEIKAGHQANTLVIRFGLLSFARPSAQRFIYKLEGLGGDWLETTQHELRFPELPPGNYTLLIKGYDGVRQWSEKPAEFAFTILPPWWANRWFQSVFMVFLVAAVFWRIRHGEHQHRKEKERLESAVEERTRQLRAEKERSDRANRLKDEFLANISHEIRTPMNGILGMTELALETTLSGEQRDYLETVKLSADSLLELLNDILDLSKIEAGHMEISHETFSLRETIQQAVRTLAGRAAEKRLDLRSEVEEATPDWLIGDAPRLRQVLLNLLGNAVKFTERGQVTLQASLRQPAGPNGRAELSIAVTDTGIGIPNDQQKLIFEAFRQADGSVTRRYGGTGLGLAISAKLVSLMGGKIEVESEVGKGSAFRFRVEVGVLGTVALPSATETPRPGGAVPRLRILLAEDNAINRTLVERLMRKHGHIVTTVNDGHEAVDQVSRDEYDLVLMDVQMPGMDGLEATRQIRALERALGTRTPIVALTANAMKGDETACIEAGMDGYLAKPFEPQKLLSEVERIARRP